MTTGRPQLPTSWSSISPPIRDKLARHLEAETLPTEDPRVRVYVGAGILVKYIAVFVTLGADGGVEAFWITIDQSPDGSHV